MLITKVETKLIIFVQGRISERQRDLELTTSLLNKFLILKLLIASATIH